MTKNNTRNTQYTKEFKDSILKRLEHPSNETVSSLAEELNISKSTIYQWVRTNNKKQKNNSIILKSKNNWTSEDKFHVVIETTSLTESELAEYCRNKRINHTPIQHISLIQSFQLYHNEPYPRLFLLTYLYRLKKSVIFQINNSQIWFFLHLAFPLQVSVFFSNHHHLI